MSSQVLAEQQASAQLAAVLLKGISNITSALAESYSEAASARANTTALAEKQVSYSFTGPEYPEHFWAIDTCGHRNCLAIHTRVACMHASTRMSGRKVREGLSLSLLQVNTAASDLPDAVAQERKAIAQVGYFYM